MNKIKRIGIIAEDESDYESTKTIIKRIINNDKIGFRPRTSNGCGKLRRKAFDYAVDLNRRGCNLLILFHDLDRNKLVELEKDLQEKLHQNPISNYFICIPVEEIEAWFLSDPQCIKNTLNLKHIPKIKANPETIESPKEYLSGIVSSCSERAKVYINTKHNALLSANISLDLMNKKCVSFAKLFNFLTKQNF